MKLRQQQRLWPFALFLFFFVVCALAKDTSSDRRNRASAVTGKAASITTSAPAHEQTQDAQHGGSKGASAFDEASAILRKIEPTVSTRAAFKKPSGIIGNTAYYAKELFVLLFMNSPHSEQDLFAPEPSQKLSAPLSKAVKLLEESAREDNQDALFLLAELNFYGNFSHPRNYPQAFKNYQELASRHGNATAQHMLGFVYATGIGGVVEPDQARAMLYHTFAAENGHTRSEMTIAFRHHAGIATPRSCENASKYYQRVADKAINHLRAGPPGGNGLYKESYRVADDNGGVYGEGASVSSSGQNAKRGGPSSDAYASLEDVLEYVELMHRKGDTFATFKLARTYYDGARGLKPDFQMAKKFFFDVARLYWRKDGKVNSDVPPPVQKLAAKAAGYIGRMFLRGEGVEQSFDIAQTWFKRGISLSADSLCQYHMGLMYLHGHGVKQNPVLAAELFGSAADQDLPAAQVKLGALFLDQGDVVTASKYFEFAARNGHTEAYYYLAELADQGLGRDKSCHVAAVYYKIVAEKAELVFSPLEEATASYESGDLQTALVAFMMAAEQGFEVAQANVAYLLDNARPSFTLRSLLSWGKRKVSLAADDALALMYWTRSAKQNNIDSMVKMGDYYLHGLGTTLDKEKAATCYQQAAETMQCAQAMWNLGWMHENGIGIEQDFHLAKRFYDLALETNPLEAYVPVTLSLSKLRLRSWWNGVTNGRIKSIQDEPSPHKSLSFSEWIRNFLENGAVYDDYEQDDWDAPTTHHDQNLADEDYYDELEESLFENLALIGLAGLLAFLVYYRNQRRVQNERDQQQGHGQQGQGANNAQAQGGQQQPQQDRGVFPDRGDPAFLDWQAGGIGH